MPSRLTYGSHHMNMLADQETGTAWDRVSRSVDDDGTIVWTKVCRNPLTGAEHTTTKRLFKNEAGVIVGATVT